MTPEEVEQTMQFLLSQQAQFSADFAKLEVKVDQVTDAVLGLTGVVGHLTGVADQLAGRQAEIERLVTEQRRETDRRFADLAEAQRALVEAQRRTEDHLDAVIVMFERHLREDHDHGPS